MNKKEELRSKLEALKAAGFTTIDDLIDMVEAIEDLPGIKEAVPTAPVATFVKIPKGIELEAKLKKVMHQLGAPAHVKGYQYVVDAIMLVIEDKNSINAVTKVLYPTVAKKNGTTSSRVERAIRHVIEIMWSRGDIKELENMFGSTVDPNKGKPTNSEFIALFADNIRMGW